MNHARRKVEVSEAEFEAAVKAHPAELSFDGRSYTERVVNHKAGLVWHKPIAVKENGKYFLVKE